MKKQKRGMGKALSRAAALGLAGAVLCGSGMQAEAATLKDLFDEHYYADTYKDLKEAFGYDREALWKHYMQYGMKEGRGMSELFDVVKYREEYKDLDAAFGNNWDAYANHYLTFGVKEGRDSGTGIEFNALDYAARYPDLKAAYGDDVLALWKHYQTSGAAENREARSEETVQEEIAAEQEAAEQEAAEENGGETQQPEGSGVRTERKETDSGWIIIEYDADGMKTKTETYDKDGNVVSTEVFKYENGKRVSSIYRNYSSDHYSVNEYDENEKQVKATWYDRNDRMFQINDYTTRPMIALNYKYDENGNVTKILKTSGIGPNRKTLEETVYEADGKIKYINYYDDDGTHTHYYYDNGKVKRVNHWKNGKNIYYTIYTYDENWKLIKTENFNPDGSVRE